MDGMWRVRSAAHYMLIEPLTYLTNTWLAFYLIEGCKGKTNKEAIDWMHEVLNIPKMTPEQEKKAREDYPWLYICLEEDLPEPEEEEAAGAEGVDDDDDENDDDDDEDEEE
jgi:hypothetical protein